MRRKSINSMIRFCSMSLRSSEAPASSSTTPFFWNHATASFFLNSTTIAFSFPSPSLNVLNSTPEPGWIMRLVNPSPDFNDVDFPRVDISISVSDAASVTGISSMVEIFSSNCGAKRPTAAISVIRHQFSNGLKILDAVAYACSTPASIDTSEILPTESASSFSVKNSELSYSAAATPLSCFLISERRSNWRNIPYFFLSFVV
mmetsp:Transcript_4128/g.10199  ORF Transcript_4128/g.10199 Transcript_4128/m.10199 type:complete len:203 (+) Transcript_4128:1356-1964(+)